MLDLQLSAARSKHPREQPRRRAGLLAFGFLFIVLLCFAALYFAKQTLAEMSQRDGRTATQEGSFQGESTNPNE